MSSENSTEHCLKFPSVILRKMINSLRRTPNTNVNCGIKPSSLEVWLLREFEFKFNSLLAALLQLWQIAFQLRVHSVTSQIARGYSRELPKFRNWGSNRSCQPDRPFPFPAKHKFLRLFKFYEKWLLTFPISIALRCRINNKHVQKSISSPTAETWS